MTNAQTVFEQAMGIIDEVAENGTVNVADTAEYKGRTLLILNTIRGELYKYSDTYVQSDDGTRPICAIIPDFETPIDLDDYICQTVMPYGLAWHLLLDENPTSASTCLQRYQELVAGLEKGFPKESEDIFDVYSSGNSFPYNYFGAW